MTPVSYVVVPKPRVCLPSVQYTNLCTEQRCFIAYLHKYGRLSQDSAPHSQIDSHLYIYDYHIHLPSTYTLLFYLMAG